MSAASAPITRYTRRIAAKLEQAAQTEQSHLTLSGLVQMMGPTAHRLLLLVVSLFNMVPGPPVPEGVRGPRRAEIPGARPPIAPPAAGGARRA